MKLHERTCRPTGPEGLLDKERITKLAGELGSGWTVEGTWLVRSFPHKDFSAGVAFAQRIAEIADKDNHHPDLKVSYPSVRVELTTHDAGGLTENDFILAAKIGSLVD
jgi:4a-hydroxytetrahydrobiopterin dehydratase